MENQINGHTKILGVIGDPIEHSHSPSIHNTICKHLGLNYIYVPFRVLPEHLEDAVKGFKAIEITGFNITIPHKKNIIKYLDKVSEEALLMGAVNTVKNVNGKFCGYNTDGRGFIKSLQQYGVNVNGKNIVVIGAGGASRGICVKMAMEQAKSITILNRTVEKAERICEVINHNVQSIARCDVLTEETIKKYGRKCDILIHTTPVGMYPNVDECPISDFNFLNSGTVVCDLIYNPPQTVLLRKAEKSGCQAVNGWGMLVFQAVDAFEIWTGAKVGKSTINHILENAPN